MRDFNNLKVWQKAHQLTLATYAATSGFPASETYGLTSQLRRAASSIPTNIAEGCGRDSDAELARFLAISMGSGNEVEYLLRLCRDLDYLTEEAYLSLRDQALETKRMLSGLLARLRPPHLGA